MPDPLETPGRVCLLVVDFSRAFTEPGSPAYCDCDDALAATAELLREARAGGAAVVFTTVAYDEAGAARARRLLDKATPLRALVRGSRAVEIDDRVAPVAGELVLEKQFISAFFGTGLSSHLAAAGCDTLVVAGTSTSGCVRQTVVDGIQHGYRVVVPAAAVADRSEVVQRTTLADMGVKYADVVDQATAARLLAA
jgi:maleamate amidohydrolase